MDSLLVSPYLHDPFSAHDHVHHQTFIITNMDHTELPTFPLFHLLVLTFSLSLCPVYLYKVSAQMTVLIILFLNSKAMDSSIQ